MMNQLNTRQLQQHVPIVAWLQIILNALMWVIGCLVFALLVGIGTIAEDQTALRVLTISGAFTAGLLFVLAVPGILAGIGLLRSKTWGRVLGVIVGVLGLLNFPIGTAVSVYTLWVLLQNSASAYFDGGGSALAVPD